MARPRRATLSPALPSQHSGLFFAETPKFAKIQSGTRDVDTSAVSGGDARCAVAGSWTTTAEVFTSAACWPRSRELSNTSGGQTLLTACELSLSLSVVG